MEDIEIHYSSVLNSGRFRRRAGEASAGWSRISSTAGQLSTNAQIHETEITVDWTTSLNIVRELGGLQRALEFRFIPKGEAEERIRKYVADNRALAGAAASLTMDVRECEDALVSKGWSLAKRRLTEKQMQALTQLLALRHGANFSVPGAGKTTVTFALHLLVEKEAPYLIVVAPPNAFLAWKEVAEECMNADASDDPRRHFAQLKSGCDFATLLSERRVCFIMSYETLVIMESEVAAFVATHPVHLVADESHKLKGGYATQRGAAMLRISHLAVRRDILSGTPMPQGASDVQSQLDFLWPGGGLGDRIYRGEKPSSVMKGRYFRINKRDLDLPEKDLHFEDVHMNDAHLALYCVVKDEVRRQASQLRRNSAEIIQARRSVMRLLQISTNPIAALGSMDQAGADGEVRALYAAVLREGSSAKVKAAEKLVRRLVGEGKKCLIWSIFTQTIEDMAASLADLNPVVIRGGVMSGEVIDPQSREGRIARFRSDPDCKVMIANPAAASEGMSLHMECHHAIYVDRSFSATHYLQSIDRIHRLGLAKSTETHIYVFRNLVPQGVGSVDMSVSRRLAKKMRALEELLNDPDLHQLALEEEESGDGIDYGMDTEDIDDLIREIEGQGSDDGEEFA